MIGKKPCKRQNKNILKKKGADYYAQNKEALKGKSRERYKNLSQEEKDKIMEYQRKRHQQLIQYKKEALQTERALFLLNIRMIEKTLKFNNIRLKEAANWLKVSKRRSNSSIKFKHSDEGFKYFIG